DELIDVVDTEDGEETNVAVTIRSTGSGTTVQCAESGTVRTNGGGTYTASIMDGTLEVSGDEWTLSQPCSAELERTRITAMPDDHHYLGALNTGFALGASDRIAVSDAYVFVLNYDEEKVYRFDLDGTNPTSWTLPDVAVDIDRNGDSVYTLHKTGDVYEWDASGTQLYKTGLANTLDVTDGSLMSTDSNGDHIYVYHNTQPEQGLMKYRANNGLKLWAGKWLSYEGATDLVGDPAGNAVWAVAANGRTYKYTNQPRPRNVSYASDAQTLSRGGDHIFVVDGSLVRERTQGGVGSYTGRTWELNADCRQFRVTRDETLFFSIEGD